MLRERRRAANFKPNRRLDRKSSRGMIYENEELRLRTININAEVERGQSDIRKLRRENEQLRREIWSLRDEYDRLDQLLRQNKNKGGHSGDSASSTKHGRRAHQEDRGDCCGEEEEDCDGEEEEDDEECCSCNRSDGDPDGEHHCADCDSGDDVYCDEENCNCGAEGRCAGASTTCDNSDKYPSAPPLEVAAGSTATTAATKNPNGSSTGSSSASAKLREHLHVNFDHLSIVSEENLTGSDGSSSVHNLPTDAAPPNSLTVPSLGPAPDGKDYSVTATSAACPPPPSSSATTMLIMSLPTTPCSPYLSDFQSIVPPLSHFETINYDDIKPLPTASPTSFPSSCSAATAACVVATSANVISSASSPLCSVSAPPPTTAAGFASSGGPAVALDVPSIAPSPEPPDSCPSELPILVASSVSSSDWIWNNKTVSFSTFRPPGAAPPVPPQSSSISATTSFPSILKCDRSPLGGGGRAGAAVKMREEGEIVVINSMPKHFFSPLKSSRSMQLPTSPDLYVHDVLASPGGSSTSINAIHDAAAAAIVAEPIYSTVHKSPRPTFNPLSISTTCSPITAVENPLYGGRSSYPYPIAGPATMAPYGGNSSTSRSPTAAFQVGGNLEELLQDIESMTDDVTHLELSYEGGVHEGDGVHRLVVASSDPLSATTLSDLTPPPNLPEPMSLLPATLPYLDFKSNTAVITTPKAAVANRESGPVASGGAQATTTVTAVVSKPISSAQAVRRKLFGKKNKEPVVCEPDHGVVPLKITIPHAAEVAGGGGGVVADDKLIGPNATGQSANKNSTTAPVGIDGGEEAGQAVGGLKPKSRRVSLSFPSFGGGPGTSSNKKGPEDEKDTSSLENLPAAAAGATQASHGKSSSGKQPLHRVSSGADISSISTSMGSPSTPVKGTCHHHRHNSQKRGKGRPGHHSRTSSESHNVYSSPNHHGHHHNGTEGRRNSTMNDAMTTSMSERNSNSLASSRESSTSLSMRSQKSRRISENSHSGGKIPWCGCWGNGCL